jgi:hypothetical protein
MGIWLLEHIKRADMSMQRLLWPDTSIKAAAIKRFTFGMADFILLLDKGEPDLGIRSRLQESGTKS